MKICIILYIVSFSMMVHGGEMAIPSELKQLQERRRVKAASEMEKIDKVYLKELQKYKVKYTKAGDLDSANAAASLIAEVSSILHPEKTTFKLFDELINTRWDFRIDESLALTFTLTRTGKIIADKHWFGFTWRVISPSEMMIDHPKGMKMVITFDEGFKSFQGIDWSGKRVAGARVFK